MKLITVKREYVLSDLQIQFLKKYDCDELDKLGIPPLAIEKPSGPLDVHGKEEFKPIEGLFGSGLIDSHDDGSVYVTKEGYMVLANVRLNLVTEVES